MARQDLVGLLTGVQSRQQPISARNPQDWRMQFGQRQSEKMNQRLRGLTGRMSTQEALGAGLSQLDLSTPEGLKTVAKLQQSTGDLTGAARTAAAVRELTRESDTRNMLAESLDKLGRPQEAEQVRNKTLDLQLAQRIVLDEQKLAKEKAIDDQQRSALMRLAVSQNNPRAVEWLKSNGDVSTIASVLLKDPTLAKAEAFSTMYDGDEALRVGIINGVLHKATDKGWEVIPDDVKLSGTAPAKVTERKPTSVAVTKEDKRVYNAVLEENEDIEATISPTWKGTDADLKTILIDKAHQIWKNADPQITREAALRKAAELEEPSDPFADA
jgi:hypothetical protein